MSPGAPRPGDPLPGAVERLGSRLLDLLGARTGRGLLLAPASVARALALVLAGAGGRTRAELAGVLGVEGLAPDDVDRRVRGLRQQLQHTAPGIELDSAGAVWAPPGTDLDPDFLRRAREVHGADARTLAGTGPVAAAAVNRWACDRTRGRITEVVGPADLPAGPGCVLTDTTYFRGRWAVPFDAGRTRAAPFTLPDGRRVEVPMMTRSGRIAHVATEHAQAVDLDYAGGDLGMVVVLPREGRPPPLPAGRGWPAGFAPTSLTLSLPRFSVGSDLDLVPALGGLGLAGLFRPGADLGPMGLPGSFVTAFRHATRLDVAEEGTEAAAATAVVVGRSLLPGTTMVVDRPFLVAVVDRRSGLVLFLGRVADPRPALTRRE